MLNPELEKRFQTIALVIVRIALGYLFFTQLWWKVPPLYGCRADFAPTTGTVDANGRAQLKRTQGLCDWMGIEAVWGDGPHPVMVADMSSVGGPRLAVDIQFLSKPNALFIQNFALPNISWFGAVVFAMEAFIAFTLIFGVFSRLGALVCLAQAMQLWIGLAGIGNPSEWEWSYNFLPVLALLMIAYAPGRSFGLDALIRPRLLAMAAKGNKLMGLIANWAM